MLGIRHGIMGTANALILCQQDTGKSSCLLASPHTLFNVQIDALIRFEAMLMRWNGIIIYVSQRNVAHYSTNCLISS
ncbi:hypothetical protein Ocin01_03117 [Orchesella cincta]|uniref:Uncharacterized protein n=1 Tax=Orchesella cincta TaxID=48709 RepID=A0A1D2NEB2_ORCCI|nr:hypothetical protein Ocin01_03117 [Orchesella cincta]